MIIHNDFREFDKEANEVDKRMYYVNTWIYRVKSDEPARNENSKVFIPDTKDPKTFISLLAHELGHSVIDPITLVDYAKYAKAVYRVLDEDKPRYMEYANVISDMIVGYHLAKDKMLKEAWRHYIIDLWNKGYNTNDKLKWVLYAYYDKVFNGKLGIYEKYKKEVNEILKVLKEEVDKVMIYRKIAKILEKAPEFKDQNQGNGQEGRGRGALADQDGSDSPPIKVDSIDVEKTIEQLAKEAGNVDDLWIMVRALAKGVGDDEAREKLEDLSDRELIYRKYQAEANKVRISVSYPKKPSYESVKLGSRRWRVSDGFREIDVKKTLFKYGYAIPTVTLRSPYMHRMSIPSDKGVKPMDLVISLDVSGSVGSPIGLMMCCADYIVIMVYALIDEAKRINQKVGITLWSDKIEYTTLPKCLGWKEAEKIKREILDVDKWGYGTDIYLALDQARKFKDKLFIVLTDGEVNPNDLIDVDNALFFLIKPSDRAKTIFENRYGKHRVISINDITDIPRIAVKWFRHTYC
ncbi:MAG: hypothetical protein DRJ30_07110 [Candidatus Methanomethylicota archaeon]|nr:MAG: hypothetical protein DRJ30_07110 [Candidatus Verstraetearchaeota archaeon]